MFFQVVLSTSQQSWKIQIRFSDLNLLSEFHSENTETYSTVALGVFSTNKAITILVFQAKGKLKGKLPWPQSKSEIFMAVLWRTNQCLQSLCLLGFLEVEIGWPQRLRSKLQLFSAFAVQVFWQRNLLLLLPMHYRLRPIKRDQFRFANFASQCRFHFLIHWVLL